MHHPFRRRATAALLAAAVIAGAACTGDDDGGSADGGDVVGTGDTYEATIRRTEGGVPHITGDSMADVSFGQGYASGEDRACDLADQVLMVTSQRARWLGPGDDDANIESDVAWLAVGIAERAAADWDESPEDVVELVTAFTDGWNAHLDEVGADGLAGWCAGAGWVRPIEPVEVYTYARAVALQASSGALDGYIASAQPPGAAPPAEAEAASSDGCQRGRCSDRRRHASERSRDGPPPAPAAHRLERVGHRRRPVGRRWRHARRQPALPLGRRAPVLGGPPHRARRDRRLWRAALGPAGHRHRVHRGVRLDPHRVRGQPVHRLPARPGPRLADHLPLRRRDPRDDPDRPHHRGAGRRRRGQRGDPHDLGQPLRPGHRLPGLRLDRRRHHHLPRRQHRRRRVPRAVPGDAAGRGLRRVRRGPRARSTASRCSTRSPRRPTGGPGTPTRPPRPTCPPRRSPPTRPRWPPTRSWRSRRTTERSCSTGPIR